MASKHSIDLTQGSVMKKLLVFALPIMLTNILQQLYHAADVAVIAAFVDGPAVASPNNVIVPIGTAMQEVFDFCGGFKAEPRKVIYGGPMMGIAVPDTTAPILKTTNGVLTFDVEKNTETWVNVIQKSMELWAMPESQTVAYSVIPETLAGGYALFASEILGSSLGNLKDYDAEIGLLPYPLFDENQANYAHYVDNHVYSYSIPTSVPDPDTVADFFTIYAYHSSYIVRPAYINVYAYDYCSDSQSAEMLDIILSTMTYDPGYLSASLEGDLSNMIQNNKNNVAQFAARKATTANQWITDFIAGIDDNNV